MVLVQQELAVLRYHQRYHPIRRRPAPGQDQTLVAVVVEVTEESMHHQAAVVMEVTEVIPVHLEQLVAVC